MIDCFDEKEDYDGEERYCKYEAIEYCRLPDGLEETDEYFKTSCAYVAKKLTERHAGIRIDITTGLVPPHFAIYCNIESMLDTPGLYLDYPVLKLSSGCFQTAIQITADKQMHCIESYYADTRYGVESLKKCYHAMQAGVHPDAYRTMLNI